MNLEAEFDRMNKEHMEMTKSLAALAKRYEKQPKPKLKPEPPKQPEPEPEPEPKDTGVDVETVRAILSNAYAALPKESFRDFTRRNKYA